MSQPSDTPESDANSTVTPAHEKDGFRGYVSTDFARDLERQRDASREDARRLATALTSHFDHYKEWNIQGHVYNSVQSALAAHEALTAKN